MQDTGIDLTDLATAPEPPRRTRRRAPGPSECIDLSAEDGPAGLSKEGLMAALGQEDSAGAAPAPRGQKRKRVPWAEAAAAPSGDSDVLFSSAGAAALPPLSRREGRSGSADGGGDADASAPLQWGSTGTRQQRRARARRGAPPVPEDDPDVAIIDLAEGLSLPAQQPRAPWRLQREPAAAAAPAGAAPAGGAAQRRRSSSPARGARPMSRSEQEVEDARLAVQLMQEEEARRRRADDFARARMQMWQELEEASSTRDRSRQMLQSLDQQRNAAGGGGGGGGGGRRHRGPSGRRHHGGAAPAASGFPGFYPPPPPPGFPAHLLFGSFGGFGGGGGGRHGHGHGHGHGGGGPPAGLPPSLMALREAVVGMQRTGLPPQLLFSDRDFTADDYEMLCRLDETVENRRGASGAQLAALPTQTAPTGGLVSEGGERLSCSICLEEFGEGQQLSTLPCVHKFHADCVRTWLQQKAACPVCQAKL
ncbi:hypothetical protein Rsub_05057 [Raphidocelis subcapitata]|uniref:RING-type domain-containing protein n=1 Tax=Raphidocelis subcapitata TaxID=307507 RepID=A0A2V0NYH1_9CHLO|nr:hypothetical protein Rsub_05057 [Raphidocelis subcapitata]|eukprot:GBF92688.1 hypothetical protein Rsub_05057 [Raphidocelis subcapitata]